MSAPEVDAGLDAGPVCRGADPSAQCVELSTFSSTCGASRAAVIAREFRGCDAGPGIVGYLGVGDCGAVETVEWTYGFPGDTYRCFYGGDGGALLGALNLSDHGVLAAGTVSACAATAPSQCRDGG